MPVEHDASQIINAANAEINDAASVASVEKIESKFRNTNKVASEVVSTEKSFLNGVAGLSKYKAAFGPENGDLYKMLDMMQKLAAGLLEKYPNGPPFIQLEQGKNNNATLNFNIESKNVVAYTKEVESIIQLSTAIMTNKKMLDAMHKHAVNAKSKGKIDSVQLFENIAPLGMQRSMRYGLLMTEMVKNLNGLSDNLDNNNHQIEAVIAESLVNKFAKDNNQFVDAIPKPAVLLNAAQSSLDKLTRDKPPPSLVTPDPRGALREDLEKKIGKFNDLGREEQKLANTIFERDGGAPPSLFTPIPVPDQKATIGPFLQNEIRKIDSEISKREGSIAKLKDIEANPPSLAPVAPVVQASNAVKPRSPSQPVSSPVTSTPPTQVAAERRRHSDGFSRIQNQKKEHAKPAQKAPVAQAAKSSQLLASARPALREVMNLVKEAKNENGQDAVKLLEMAKSALDIASAFVKQEHPTDARSIKQLQKTLVLIKDWETRLDAKVEQAKMPTIRSRA